MRLWRDKLVTGLREDARPRGVRRGLTTESQARTLSNTSGTNVMPLCVDTPVKTSTLRDHITWSLLSKRRPLYRSTALMIRVLMEMPSKGPPGLERDIAMPAHRRLGARFAL